MKSFRKDLLTFLEKIKKGENFSFARFSDGEEFILQDRYLEINSQEVKAGDLIFYKGFSKEDHKVYDPSLHQFYRERLIEAYKYKAPNYYKGIPCKCCVGEARNKWMIDFYGKEDDSLTWANLFVNGNYPLFIELFVPEIGRHKTILICNEKADLLGLPFTPVKDFRCGPNCFINNYGLIEDIKTFIQTNNITNHIFLFAASTLSKVAIHQLYKFNTNNTYLDIGTCLNKYLGMSLDRDYLKNQWLGTNFDLGNRFCIW